MKSFKEYLTESKKVYEFKVKVAGPCPKDMVAHIKNALSPYKVESCSAGKGTPIQETQEEFPSLKHVELTVFDVTTSYPVTSIQVKSAIAECASIPSLNLIVRTLAEQEEYNINHANDVKSGAVLGKDYENSNNQDLVGDKYNMKFLQELSKTKHEGQAVTGYNDQLLAKKAPVDKSAEAAAVSKSGSTSAIGSKKIKLPDPMKDY